MAFLAVVWLSNPWTIIRHRSLHNPSTVIKSELLKQSKGWRFAFVFELKIHFPTNTVERVDRKLLDIQSNVVDISADCIQNDKKGDKKDRTIIMWQFVKGDCRVTPNSSLSLYGLLKRRKMCVGRFLINNLTTSTTRRLKVSFNIFFILKNEIRSPCDTLLFSHD